VREARNVAEWARDIAGGVEVGAENGQSLGRRVGKEMKEIKGGERIAGQCEKTLYKRY
jgi:hypothetical protein